MLQSLVDLGAMYVGSRWDPSLTAKVTAVFAVEVVAILFVSSERLIFPIAHLQYYARFDHL